MHDIFISYSRKDTKQVTRLANLLEEHGYNVWWDKTLLASQDYTQKIDQALNNSKCILTVWSPNAVLSKWVRAESNRGFTQEKLVPVIIEDATIPIPFDSIHTASLKNWANGTKAGNGELTALLQALDWQLGTAKQHSTTPGKSAAPPPLGKLRSPKTSHLSWALACGLFIAIVAISYLSLSKIPATPVHQPQGLISNAVESLELRTCRLPNAKESIVQAAGRNHIERVRECVAMGLNINTQDANGWTALHAAAKSGNILVARFLVSKLADIHIKNNEQQSALYVGVMHNQHAIVDYLKQSGAVANEPDNSGTFTCARAKDQMKLVLEC